AAAPLAAASPAGAAVVRDPPAAAAFPEPPAPPPDAATSVADPPDGRLPIAFATDPAWPLPIPPAGERARPDVASLVDSLQRTTARLVDAAEARFSGRDGGDDGESAGFDEKDLRTLGALAVMLAKVIALDRQPRSARDDPSARPDPRPADPADPTADATADGPIDFDDPRQRDAFSERLERFVAERAAGLGGPVDQGGEGGA
ncbi:MAG TPA: hypothetical protein VMP03_13720, partial [Methylomirabilota bacterium]|nr:hypothetical protein [Methylomirabilota bacterium]